jgi:nucleotide-binding universal stress UspA family protein
VEVLKTARLLGPDLLVLGGLDEVERCRRELTGSATKAALVIAASAPCPVLVVPGEAPLPSTPFLRVLIATDLLPGADAVLGAAARLAMREGASLRAFHALPVPEAKNLPQALRKATDQLAYLGRALPLAKAMDIAVREGDPAVEILKDARECQADLLVLAADRYGQDDSVPSRVLEGARCPVLLVGPQGLADLAHQSEPAAAAGG